MGNVNQPATKITLLELEQALKDGLSSQAICSQFGISRQGLHARCKRYGLSELLRANKPPSITPLPKTHFLVQGWLVERKMRKELLRQGATKAYRQQKNTAYWRGIEWEISFKDWWEIWQQSGKWGERGRTKGCYVMARYGDVGPYKVGNVVIQTHGENATTAQAHAKKDRQPETKGVFLVYPNSKKPWLARLKRKHLGFFETEEKAIEARKKALQEA